MDKSTHYNSDRKVSCPAGSADWENALIEYESNSRDKGLWARLLAFHDGDENKAKAEYLSIKAMENASKRVIVPDKNGEGSVEADNEYLVWLFKNKKIEVFEGKTSIVRDRMWNWRDKSFDQRANLLSEIIKVRSIIYYREEVQVNVEGKSKIINSSQMDALLAYLERR